MKKVMFLSVSLMVIFFSLSGVEVTSGKYSFSIDGENYTTDPSDREGNESQGMAHAGNTNWFLSQKEYLYVYNSSEDNYFETDAEKMLLAIELSWECDYSNLSKGCLPAAHLGDLDFNQEKNFLYIPLEHMYTSSDDSGYAVYKWANESRDLVLKKLVFLESNRGGGSAPYVAYNSIDKLIYLHGTSNRTSNGVLCRGSRICGYNPEDTIETTVSEYLGNVDAVIAAKEEKLSVGLELKNYLTADSSNEIVLSEEALNLFNNLCSSEEPLEKCLQSVEDSVSYYQISIRYITGNKDSVIYKTKAPEKVIVMVAECGMHWACDPSKDNSCEVLFEKDGIKYCEVDHSSDSDFSKQGAVFSPNHRLLFYVHDSDSDSSDNAKAHAYYFPVSEFLKFHEGELDEPIYAVFAGEINHSIRPGGAYGEELEGMDVWAAQIGGIEYDIHLMMLDNDYSSSDDYYIYHWSSPDYDGDGVKDTYDNCLLVSNPGQEDSNDVGLGDACNPDVDRDGVDVKDDNCQTTFNPDQQDWNIDKIGDACQDSDGDKWMDDKDPCPDQKNETASKNLKTLKCRGDIDNTDCITQRKICDMDGDGRWDLEPEEEYGIDNYAYSASGYWSKLGENINIENCEGITCTGTQEIGYKLSVTQRASYFCDQNDAKSKLSTYYCYCGNTSILHGKCYDDGDCGKDHANPNEVWDYVQGHATWVPVFSEFPEIDTNSEGCWKSGGKFDKIKKLSKNEEWDYQNDKYLKKLLTDDDFSVHIDGESVRQSGNYTMLKLSQGVVTGSSSSYVTTTASGGHNLNKNYFSNYNQTHVLGNKAKLILAKQNSEYVDIIIEEVSYLRIRVNTEQGGYGKWWYDMMREYLGIKPWDDPEWRWKYGFEDRVKNNLYESIMRPSEFSRVGFDGNSISLESVSFKEDYNQIFSFGGRDVAYFMKDGEFNIAFTDVNGIFNDVKPVAYGIEMRSAAALTSGTEIFMAAGFKERTARTSSEHADINSAEQMPERSASFAKISFSDNGAYMTTLSPLPWEPVHISLFEVEGRIHSIMMDGNGAGEILVYQEDNDYWEKLSDFDFGKVFSLNNTFVKGNELYFTAPGPNDQNTLYSWSSESGINEVASLGISYYAFIKPLNSGEKIILADLKDISGNISAWELSEGEFTPVSIQIEKPEYETAFCINEINGSIFPGATNYKGQCISVYDYNYQTVSYLDYKKTVAGHKNNLYLGGLTGVRRVEINEDGLLSNSDMLYTGETNNLAVYGNTMYGANYGEIDIYAIAENGSVSRVKGISSSSCGNVRVSGGSLFTAENKKVRVFDLTDPLNPVLIKTITTAGKVIDLEIIGERLYIYEETTSWLTTKGFTGIYDISDIISPVRLKYFEKRCTDAEMQKSGPSTGSGQAVYLGCKNGQYRIEETGLISVSGEKNYVREGYVFEGNLYQVFSGALHKSKVSEIQLECGNGMIEQGEVCDSDTIQCSEFDAEYIGGTAACNSTCDGYNESVCETDGW